VKRDELAELLLTYLYDCAENAGHSYFFFTLNDFAARLGINEANIITESAMILESRGFVLLSLDGSGGITALINDDGCVFVEKGGETGIIQKYRKDPASFLVSETEGVSELSLDYKRVYLANDVHALFVKVVEMLRSDASIERHRVEETLGDIEMINLQLARKQTDTALLDTLLDKLSQIPPIASHVFELKKLIHEYIRHA